MNSPFPQADIVRGEGNADPRKGVMHHGRNWIHHHGEESGDVRRHDHSLGRGSLGRRGYGNDRGEVVELGL